MADLLFLGTGGGRVNLLRQLRGTGGFLIQGSGLNIHVDPGPGALAALLECGIDPLTIDAAILTHDHIDHTHDIALIIEAMTGHMLKKGGTVIASKSVLVGDSQGDKAITHYHQSMLAKKTVLSAGMKETCEFEKGGKKFSFSITGTPVVHEDKTGFGFVLEMDGAKIGYTSDTEFFDALPPHFAGCDALIANNIKGADDAYLGHLNSATTARLFSEAKPKFGIITHLGMRLILSGAEAEAQKIQKASGVPTYAARDGFYFCTDRCGWFRATKAEKGKTQGTQSSL